MVTDAHNQAAAAQHAANIANHVSAIAAATSVTTGSASMLNLVWQYLPTEVAVVASMVAIITGVIAGMFYLVQIWDSPWYKRKKQRKHRNKLRRARYRDHKGASR